MCCFGFSPPCLFHDSYPSLYAIFASAFSLDLGNFIHSAKGVSLPSFMEIWISQNHDLRSPELQAHNSDCFLSPSVQFCGFKCNMSTRGLTICSVKLAFLMALFLMPLLSFQRRLEISVISPPLPCPLCLTSLPTPVLLMCLSPQRGSLCLHDPPTVLRGSNTTIVF